jgi:hypothetical protein
MQFDLGGQTADRVGEGPPTHSATMSEAVTAEPYLQACAKISFKNTRT